MVGVVVAGRLVDLVVVLVVMDDCVGLWSAVVIGEVGEVDFFSWLVAPVLVSISFGFLAE
ncbi:MAG: hypothetical protein WC433_07700 [Candidatus Omnitrophota bacterium]